MIVVNTGLLGFTESFFASSALAARERVAIAARNKIFFISFLKLNYVYLRNGTCVPLWGK
jgi:hypothetical protein